jgi:hypothetical protein
VSTPAQTFLLLADGRAGVLAQVGPWSDDPDAVTTVHVTRDRATADAWLAELEAGRVPLTQQSDPRAEAVEDPTRPIGGVTEAQLTVRHA